MCGGIPSGKRFPRCTGFKIYLILGFCVRRIGKYQTQTVLCPAGWTQSPRARQAVLTSVPEKDPAQKKIPRKGRAFSRMRSRVGSVRRDYIARVGIYLQLKPYFGYFSSSEGHGLYVFMLPKVAKFGGF